MANKNKAAPASGGSRTLSYIIIAVLAFLIFYTLVLPAFTPRSTSTASTSTSTTAATLSLTPSTNIANTMVTISGQMLPANQNVTVMFSSTPIPAKNLTGTCFTNASGVLSGCNFWVPKNIASGSYAVSVTAGATTAKTTFTVPQYSPPVSTIVVTLTSVSLGFVTQLVTRKVVDLNKERKMRAEVNAFNKEKREATLAKDKVKLDKLKKRELQVRQEQAKVSTSRLKVTAITFVPLLAVYYLMATFLGGYGVIVAFTPIPIPVIAAPTPVAGIFEVSLFWWYFLSSFTFSTMLSRLLHTTT
jgi:uncharacterized membrane protein (DUF106 family)